MYSAVYWLDRQSLTGWMVCQPSKRIRPDSWWIRRHVASRTSTRSIRAYRRTFATQLPDTTSAINLCRSLSLTASSSDLTRRSLYHLAFNSASIIGYDHHHHHHHHDNVSYRKKTNNNMLKVKTIIKVSTIGETVKAEKSISSVSHTMVECRLWAAVK